MEVEQKQLNGEDLAMKTDGEEHDENEVDEYFRITNCPADIIEKIGWCLSIKDLFNLALTCKYLNRFSKKELWHRRKDLQNGRRHLDPEPMPPMGMQGRYGHSICYHAPHNRVYICGGRTDQGAILNDMSHFDLETQRWGKDVYSDTTRLAPSKCLYAVLCSYKDSLYLFGGYHYDPTPANGTCKVFTLNFTDRRWTAIYTQSNIQNLYGHSAIMHHEGFMVVFGGYTMNGIGGNEMYTLDCNSKNVSVVAQNNDRPSPRLFSALAFADDNHLVVLGGQTGIDEDYEILHDAYLFTFTNQQKTEGYWTTIEIEGADLWPTSTATFSQAGTTLYMISQPTDTTHIFVDNSLICKLYESGTILDRAKNGQLYCSNALMPHRRRDSMFGVTSGRYLQDISLMDPENQALVQGQVLSEFGLGDALESLVRDCHSKITEFYAKRQVFLGSDDLQCVLLWLNSGRHSKTCRKYRLGPYKSCHGPCFTQEGCMYKILRKYLQCNGETFLQQLCATLYHFTSISVQDLSQDYPPLDECDYWKGKRRGCIIPMTELLRLQSFIPVHRIFFDAPLSVAVFKFDLTGVVTEHIIKLKQDPVRFMAPFYNKYSSMAYTENGFLLCGGVSGEWANLIANFPHNPRRPSTDTIFIS